MDRAGVGEHPDPAAVLSLGDDLHAADRSSFAERDGGWALGVLDRLPVPVEQEIRAAPLLALTGRPAPELRCGGVVVRDPPGLVDRIDGHAQGVEKRSGERSLFEHIHFDRPPPLIRLDP
jgi:hypothetical protein